MSESSPLDSLLMETSPGFVTTVATHKEVERKILEAVELHLEGLREEG